MALTLNQAPRAELVPSESRGLFDICFFFAVPCNPRMRLADGGYMCRVAGGWPTNPKPETLNSRSP